ncbi:hypothetical protein ES703_34151 [subsurface metagenome]
MQSEQDIKQLKEELAKLTGFIYEHGSPEQVGSRQLQFSCDVCDALAWVLEEISTDDFKSNAHVDLNSLKSIAAYIEETTSKKLTDYE